MENKSWKFIPIDKVPASELHGFYSAVINDFLKTGHEIAKLEYSGFKCKKMASILASLRKASKGKARIIKRGKDIILLRLKKTP